MKANTLVRLARMMIRRRVAGNDNHRRGIARGCHDSGERVGQAGRQMHVDHCKLMRHAIVGVCGVRCELLMTKGDVVDAVLLAGVDERVVGVPALSKDLGDAFVLEARGDKHGTVHE